MHYGRGADEKVQGGAGSDLRNFGEMRVEEHICARGGLVEVVWGWLRTMLMMETARMAAAMEGSVRDFMGDGKMVRERVRRLLRS